MLADRIVYRKGDFIPWNQANVHMMSHSFGRGFAVFEILSFRETPTGLAVFRLDKHLDRLFRSAGFVDMELAISREDLHEAVLLTVKENSISHGFIKIVGYYPQIAFGANPPKGKADIAIFAFDLVKDLGEQTVPPEQSISLCISKWQKLDPQTVPIEAKVAANYLNGIMAIFEAGKRGFENAVMLDTQGFIAEGAVDSIFLVKEGRLFTPSLGTVLESISRMSVIDAAKTIGVEAFEGRLTSVLFFEADEIFMSNTSHRVLTVRQIEDRKLEDTPGPISRKLMDLFAGIESGRDERFKEWLFAVA